MKILVVSQYYCPEPFRISDICEEMVKRGHDVTVLTGIPNYPEGKIYNDYKRGKKRNEIINGVKVRRCFTIGRRTGILYRFLNYYSYAISSTINVVLNRCKPETGGKFDIIFVNQLSPVMMAYAGMVYKKINHKKIILYCLDLWPESLVAGGIKRKSFIYTLFHRISKHIYESCDKILVTSRMFQNYISNEFGINKKNIIYLPQYAEDLFDTIKNKSERKENLDLVFAGNIGEVQNVETIIEAAEILKDEKIKVHIIGSGSDLERCKRITKNKKLDNVIFYGRRPVTEMPLFYSLADAMLITLVADPTLSLTLPGKVQSYMAAGKPIIGAINGEANTVIDEAMCGFVGKAESAKELAGNIKKFMLLDDYEKNLLGKNAKKYYKENFSKDIFIKRIEEIFKI
ncbi:glycosyltransferase family 4 protein [Massilimicrobiota timonensis]|uniref:glycosyltransferase family 4 protein n=1 Tax=Massilimicrobiota timonensis TaxID=1776392 RepID=UPI00101D29F5|nr:glycosyltransferase family 4 protein [Massilimicrobiota timonensis]